LTEYRCLLLTPCDMLDDVSQSRLCGHPDQVYRETGRAETRASAETSYDQGRSAGMRPCGKLLLCSS